MEVAEVGEPLEEGRGETGAEEANRGAGDAFHSEPLLADFGEGFPVVAVLDVAEDQAQFVVA